MLMFAIGFLCGVAAMFLYIARELATLVRISVEREEREEARAKHNAMYSPEL